MVMRMPLWSVGLATLIGGIIIKFAEGISWKYYLTYNLIIFSIISLIYGFEKIIIKREIII